MPFCGRNKRWWNYCETKMECKENSYRLFRKISGPQSCTFYMCVLSALCVYSPIALYMCVCVYSPNALLLQYPSILHVLFLPRTVRKLKQVKGVIRSPD